MAVTQVFEELDDVHRCGDCKEDEDKEGERG